MATTKSTNTIQALTQAQMHLLAAADSLREHFHLRPEPRGLYLESLESLSPAVAQEQLARTLEKLQYLAEEIAQPVRRALAAGDRCPF